MNACTCVCDRYFNEEIHKKVLKFDTKKIFIMYSLGVFTWGSYLMNIINTALQLLCGHTLLQVLADL